MIPAEVLAIIPTLHPVKKQRTLSNESDSNEGVLPAGPVPSDFPSVFAVVPVSRSVKRQRNDTFESSPDGVSVPSGPTLADFPEVTIITSRYSMVIRPSTSYKIGGIYVISPYGINIQQFVQIVSITPTGRPRAVLLQKAITLMYCDGSRSVRPGLPVNEKTHTFSKINGGSIKINELKYYLHLCSEYDPNNAYIDRYDY